MFCTPFCVWKAIFICVYWKSFVIFLTSLPLYVKVDHFITWCCESVYVFCFCGPGCFLFGLCYSDCYGACSQWYLILFLLLL
jgi:hypothetical protein